MLDAYSRIPRELTEGNNVDFGMFDQCINIKESLNNTSIQGKYCYGGLVLPITRIKEMDTAMVET